MVQKEAQKLQLNQEIDKIRQTWPQPIPDTLKKKIVKLFNEKTSSECLASFTCASCSSSTLNLECKFFSLSEINIDLLKPFNKLPAQMPIPRHEKESFASAIINPEGVIYNEEGHPILKLCKTCYNAL